MSEMRTELLRTLDRIVGEHLTPAARANAEIKFGDISGEPRGALLRPLWKAMEEAGFHAIAGRGGDSDLSFPDAMALVRRAAYHAVPLPIGDSIIARWLAGRAGLTIPDGQISLMMDGSEDPVELVAVTSVAGAKEVQISGELGGHVMIAGTGAGGEEQLAVLDVGSISAVVWNNIAGEQRFRIKIALSQEDQQLVSLVDWPDARAELFMAGALLRSVQMAGAMDRVQEHCLTWANDRVQFGKPIARFQAIQHQLAVLASEVAAAGAATDMAIEAFTERPDVLAIAVAKARVGEAAGKVANIAHAVFGAMGFTQEHTLHLSTRRLWAWRNEFGGEAYWQAELGRNMASVGGAGLWAELTARDR